MDRWKDLGRISLILCCSIGKRHTLSLFCKSSFTPSLWFSIMGYPGCYRFFNISNLKMSCLLWSVNSSHYFRFHLNSSLTLNVRGYSCFLCYCLFVFSPLPPYAYNINKNFLNINKSFCFLLSLSCILGRKAKESFRWFTCFKKNKYCSLV